MKIHFEIRNLIYFIQLKNQNIMLFLVRLLFRDASIRELSPRPPACEASTLYHHHDTYRQYILRIFYPGMKYPPLAFSSVNWCKIDVFSLNIMALHPKKSQTVNITKNTK